MVASHMPRDMVANHTNRRHCVSVSGSACPFPVPVEFHILLSLAVGERHGYGIIQDIEARGETSVPDVGPMYRALMLAVRLGGLLAKEIRD